jgi:hypothetical protein
MTGLTRFEDTYEGMTLDVKLITEISSSVKHLLRLYHVIEAREDEIPGSRASAYAGRLLP